MQLAQSAQQHVIDVQKSTLATIHVGKTGLFSGLGHEHVAGALIHSGTADTGSRPAVEIRVIAAELRVIDKDESDKDRADVQTTTAKPDVLDSEHSREIVFKSNGADASGPGQWTPQAETMCRAATRPVTVQGS